MIYCHQDLNSNNSIVQRFFWDKIWQYHLEFVHNVAVLILLYSAQWLLLTRLGIPNKIVRLFRVLYDNSVSCVRTGGTHSSWFKIKAGVRQGCVLAPDSFAQAWIGCWTGLLNLARLVWCLAKAPSLIWILLTMSLSC